MLSTNEIDVQITDDIFKTAVLIKVSMDAKFTPSGAFVKKPNYWKISKPKNLKNLQRTVFTIVP